MRSIVNMTEEDRAKDRGNMQHACSSGGILAERQTDRQTDRQTHKQTYSSQYFATAPTGEVNINAVGVPTSYRHYAHAFISQRDQCEILMQQWHRSTAG